MSIQLFCATYDIDSCLKEIKDCFEKGWTGMGYKTEEFEEKWKTFTGCRNAYFTNSATAALNLAVSTLKDIYEWKDGDEVISTSLTFVSTNHAILRAGLKPVFADIDETFCLDPRDVKSKINSRTKAVMYVGFGGNTGRYEEVAELCRKNGLKLILDAAHMAGTRLDGKTPGKETDAVIYSFQAVKNLPTGDAGMLCMADAECDRVAREKGWLGINQDTYKRSTEQAGSYKWKYDVCYLGDKYNGNSIMAAIALSQLPHLEEGNNYRRKLTDIYTNGLSDVTDYICTPRYFENCTPSRHLFQILVPDRDGLIEYLNGRDIFPGVHYTPNTEYLMYSYGKGTCPHVEYVGAHVLSLPLHIRVTEEDAIYVAECIKEYVLGRSNARLQLPGDWALKGWNICRRES